MIRFFENTGIDRQKWDEVVTRSPDGVVYVFTWFLDIVCPGWCGLVLDDYSLVFPLPLKKKAGFRYLMQPAFTQRLGLMGHEKVTQTEVEEFLAETISRFRYIHFNLPDFASSGSIGGAQVIPRSNYELMLNGSYEKLSSSYSENLRRNLRKSRGNDFTRMPAGPGDVIRLFRINRGAGIRYLRSGHYKILEKLVSHMLGQGLCRIDALSLQGELCAGIVWIITPDRAVLLFSALSDRGRKAGAMPYLVDQFIRENAGKEMVLDFEGSDDSQLARFYASFGATDNPYVTLHKEQYPLCADIPVKGYRTIRRWIQKVI